MFRFFGVSVFRFRFLGFRMFRVFWVLGGVLGRFRGLGGGRG